MIVTEGITRNVIVETALIHLPKDERRAITQRLSLPPPQSAKSASRIRIITVRRPVFPRRALSCVMSMYLNARIHLR